MPISSILLHVRGRGAPFVVFLLGLAACGIVASPSRADAQGNLLTGYSLTSWNEGDGHPLGSVFAIVQDKAGYLWIGADSGLFRFDGSRFTPWSALSQTPLPSVAVRALYVARDGSLWVGLADGGGVYRIRDDLFQPEPLGLRGSAAVTELAEDHEGVVWAISERVLYSLRDNQWRKEPLPWKTREGQVLQPLLSRAGDFWIGTRWGVFRRPRGSAFFEPVSDEYVWGLGEDSSGAVWTTHIVAGFRRLDAPVPDLHGLEGAGYRLLHDRGGNLWIATFGEGLWRVRAPASKGPVAVERANLRSGLSSDSVQSLLEDRDGNIWVGTTGGLHRFTERKLTPVENVAFVVPIEPGGQSRIWAGTTNGLMQFMASPTKWQRAAPESKGLDIRSLYQDPDGSVWVGSTEGLWHFKDGRLTRIPLGQRSQPLVLSIAPDAHRGLWLRDSEWLSHWNGSRLSPFKPPPELSRASRITYAHADSRKRLWVGFAGGRLGFMEDTAFHVLGAADGFPDNTHRTIYAVLDDDHDVVWIGGSGGLTRFAHGRAITITSASGLPGDRVWALVEDRQHQLWLSMDRGLVRLDPGEVVKAGDDPAYRVQYTMYDAHDGLAGAAIGVIDSVRATDGTLWFVRGGGVTVVNPATLAGDRASGPAPVHIETVVANEERFSPSSLHAFEPGTKRVQISYTALTLSPSNRIRFRYWLEGFDDGWVDAGTRRTAYYTNLSPGNYQFHVEAGTEDAWSTSSAEWAFSIRPAFHQTGWFYAVCVGVVGMSLWGAWGVRLRLARRQFSLALAERARLSREIHDTLLQSLVGVALQLDAVSSSLGPATPGARGQLTRVRRQVESYIREARQSIWDLRSPSLEYQGMAAALRQFGRRAVADTSARFVLSVTGTPYRCAPKLENHLLRIGQEAITNAVRHAGATRILLDLAFEDQAITLRVSDDGCGFEILQPTTDPGRHYGLTTMRERADELDGELTLLSEPGRGTSVRVVIPTSAAVREPVSAEG